MRQVFLILALMAATSCGALAQATLRVGDPVDIKIGGIPSEEQVQVNNTYTVDTNGSVNLPYINRVQAEA
jgi:protein involved in polysaccharide export with SLBB domain